MAVLCTDHHILMDGGLVHAALFQLLLGQAGAALGGAGVAGTKGDVAGSVLIEQGAVEQRAAAVDGAGCGHQCHLTDMAGTLIGIQQPAQQVSALLGSMLNDLAILEGDMESLDELAIEHIGLGAVDDAVHLILVGSGEHFLGGDVGQEEHALLVLAAGALPAGLLGQAHGQVSAVGALKVDALQIKSIHLLAQTGQTVQMCLPLVDGVTAGHAADIKDELPQLLDGCIRIQLGEHLLCPGGAGHGGNGPLHPVVHGVLPPGSHKFPVGGVHTADLGTIQTGVDLGVIRNEVQHADTALALCIVEVAAQLVGLAVGQGFLAAQLHPGAGNGIVTPVHLNITGSGLEAAAHAQAGQRGSLQRAADDHGLARLRVHAHPDDKVSVFFEQFIKVFHKRFLSAARNGTVVLP